MRIVATVPDSWTTATLGELGEWRGGGTPSKNQSRFWKGGTIPWVSPKDMKSDVISSAEERITESALKESSAKMIPAGSVLVVTRSGILEHTLPIARTACDVAINQDLKALVPYRGLDPDFLAYAFRRYSGDILQECSKTGTTVASVVTEKLASFRIPIAPTAEQHRIVQALEGHFTHIEAGVSGLKRLRANLNRYRASVLKAACEGKLVPTEAKLASQEDRDYESADILLERILAEHGRRSQTQVLEKVRTKEKQPRARGWKEKYTPSEGPDTSRLPELPGGWVWALLEQLFEILDHRRVPVNAKERAQRPGDVPYYGATGQVGWIDGYLFDEELLLLGEDGAPFLDLTKPKSYVIRGKAWVNNHAHVLRALPGIDLLFAKYQLDQVDYRPYVGGTTRHKLTQADMRRIPLAIPPLSEQERIRESIERHASVWKKLQMDLEAENGRAERLRQAILVRALDGRLVQQDPTDEPASVLLARIRSGSSNSNKKLLRVARQA